MIMHKALLAFAILSLSSMTMSAAVITTWNFAENGTGDLGLTSLFAASLSGPSLTVSGFSSNDTPVQLFGKNAGGNEVGLGLDMGHDLSHEITGNGFVQVDISPLLTGYSSLTFQMNSSTVDDGWVVYATNTAGSTSGATLLKSGTNELAHKFTTNKTYLDFKANDGDVLLRQMTATTNAPEPGTLGLLGAGLALMGTISARLRKRA